MTQFELATAAAFVAFAAARVEVAVVEAGLGGRLDATNTIPSQVTVLTSIGLDHTEWLGETELEIAAEKLAVLRDHTTLVLGRVSPDGRGAGGAHRRRAGGEAGRRPRGPGEGIELRAAGRFQRRNFALACAAAEAFLGELDPARVADGGGEPRPSPAGSSGLPTTRRPTSTPPTTPTAPPPWPRALPRVAAGRPVVACLAVLADKDAEAMVARPGPSLSTAVVCTELPAGRRCGARRCQESARTSPRELARACARPGWRPSGARFRRRDGCGRETCRWSAGGILLDHRLALRPGARPVQRSLCARIEADGSAH